MSRAPDGASAAYIEMALAYEGDDCLIWPYTRNEKGYGLVSHQGRQWRAHRLVLTLTAGPPPFEKAEAAHAPIICHERACVSPRHLRWATANQNNQDKHLDGTIAIGERAYQAKLTEEQVRAIRASTLSRRLLGVEYGVSDSAIQRIRDGKTWKHL